MSNTINKLIRKEIIFTFRPIFIIVLIAGFMFFQIFKIFSNVWSVVYIPTMFCAAFALSGSVKGYGTRAISVFVSPIKRVEYIKAKYIFSVISTLLAISICFAFDILLWKLKINLLGESILKEYTFEGLMLVYPLVVIVVGLTLGFLVYGGTCGKINYTVVMCIPIGFSALFTSLGSKIPYVAMIEFWNSIFIDRHYSYVAYVLTCMLLSAGVIYISYLKCSRAFQKSDL